MPNLSGGSSALDAGETKKPTKFSKLENNASIIKKIDKICHIKILKAIPWQTKLLQ